ncbi:hypothetical protein ACFX2A_011664 [Malus domestica]
MVSAPISQSGNTSSPTSSTRTASLCTTTWAPEPLTLNTSTSSATPPSSATPTTFSPFLKSSTSSHASSSSIPPPTWSASSLQSPDPRKTLSEPAMAALQYNFSQEPNLQIFSQQRHCRS